MTSARPGWRARVITPAASLVGLVLLWHLIARGQSDITLPAPCDTFGALIVLAGSGELASELLLTMWRSALGVAAALAVALPLGMLCGLSSLASRLLAVPLQVLMAVPPVVLVVVAMIWFGPGTLSVLTVVILVGIPLVSVATDRAVRSIDADLVDMVRTFEMPAWRRMRHLLLPAIASPVLAAVSVLIGQSLRVTVMAELLAASTGVGHAVAASRSNLDTATLFAWASTLAVAGVLLDCLVVRPMTRYATAWRG